MMTLCSLLFDLAVVGVMFMIKKDGLERSRPANETQWSLDKCLGSKSRAEAARFLLTLSKSVGLAVSAAWVITDLLFLASAAPGQGTLILGSVAAAATLLVLCAEFGGWLYVFPKAVKRFREAVNNQELGSVNHPSPKAELVQVKQ